MSRVFARSLAGCAALAAVVTVATVGPAAPAFADPAALSGRYAAVGGSDQFYVTATSTCATEGCTANLVSNRGWTSTATLTGGRWNYNVVKPDGAICSDGNFADIVIRYSIDANTLAGTVTADSNGECPGGQITQYPIQLTRIG